MGNARVAAQALAGVMPQRRPLRLVEIGAGDGLFTAEVLRSLGGDYRAGEVLLVDQQELVREETARDVRLRGWTVRTLKADVFDFLAAAPGTDIVLANLFVHHFTQERLHELFEHLSRITKVFVAVEPRRGVLPLVFSRFVGLIGCNRVTRHDAPVSVQAGFAGQDLSALWPKTGNWRLGERASGFFSHLFIAEQLD